jgi:hypothetical protein
MSWEAIGALGEWIGALGVVISIVFLASQVRSNTRALRARAAYDANIGWATLNEQLFFAVYFSGDGQGRPNFAEEAMRLWAADADPKDISPAQLFPCGTFWRSHLQKLEAQYWLSRHGLLAPEQWRIKASFFAGFLQLPVPRAWWESERQLGIHSAEFCAALDAVRPPSLRWPAEGESGPSQLRGWTRGGRRVAGTRLSLVQSGFEPDQKRAFGGARYGWKLMGGKLVDVLARMT